MSTTVRHRMTSSATGRRPARRAAHRRASIRLLAAVAASFAVTCATAEPAHGSAAPVSIEHRAQPVSAVTDGGTATVPTREPWAWPVMPVRVLAEFEQPAHDYAAGHRGMDLAGGEVRAPAGGVIAFSGVVVDRPLITIDHGDGLVTTLEPVESELSPGDAVAKGDVVGTVASGGHAPAGAVHFGVRLHGEYINPRLLLGGIPRAVLLPCCS